MGSTMSMEIEFYYNAWRMSSIVSMENEFHYRAWKMSSSVLEDHEAAEDEVFQYYYEQKLPVADSVFTEAPL